MLMNQLLSIASGAPFSSREGSGERAKKHWAPVPAMKFIKTKHIIFYEAILKQVTEGEPIDWRRMNFSHSSGLN